MRKILKFLLPLLILLGISVANPKTLFASINCSVNISSKTVNFNYSGSLDNTPDVITATIWGVALEGNSIDEGAYTIPPSCNNSPPDGSTGGACSQGFGYDPSGGTGSFIFKNGMSTGSTVNLQLDAINSDGSRSRVCKTSNTEAPTPNPDASPLPEGSSTPTPSENICDTCPPGTEYNGGACVLTQNCLNNSLCFDYNSPPPTPTHNKCVPGATCDHSRGFIDPSVKIAALPLPCNEFEGNGCRSINTALGSIPTDIPGFVKWILTIVLSVAGGITLLLIIASGYRLMASQGDPEKVKEAREGLTAAVVGLLFIIFSIVILQFITVDVLHIPGFNP
jgi:hypothetical protein